ncbi:MAG: Gfo/Idh/MocA family oxidoreductase [Sphingobium sp.]
MTEGPGNRAPLRVGIISAAWGVKAHLPAWRTVEGVEVTAICTSRPETAAAACEATGVPRAFHDFRAMAADPDIDIVDCGTRPPLRHAMVLAALEAGKHVYNGIPFAKDMTDARDMVAAWRKAGTVAAVDAFTQAVPALVRAKELLDEGALGDIFGARIFFDAPLFTAAQVNVPGYVWFADPANGASAMRNLGSHMTNLMVHLLGPIERVVADSSLRLHDWPGEPVRPAVPDTETMMVRFASGVPGQINACWSMLDGPGFRLEIWGSKGRLEATAPVFPQAHDTRLFLSHDPGLGRRTATEVELPDRLLGYPGTSARAERPADGLLPMAAIFASMRDEIWGVGKAAPDFAQALHVQQVIEAAALSAREERWARVDEL